MIKKCVICGTDFLSAPSSKKITCGRSCSAARKRLSHTDKHNKWSDQKKEKRKLKDFSDLQKSGTCKAKISPISGPYETNQEAKFWVVIDPDGVEYQVKNLALFCRVNAHRFLPNTPEQAYAGLREVNKWLRGKSKRTVSQYKGWTLKQPSAQIPGADPSTLSR